MAKPTIEETWTLLFLALTTLLMVVIYGTVHLPTAYAYVNAPKYEKTEAVVGNSTANIPSTPTPPSNATTSAQLKTYTDPSRFFTLQYPANWTVNYKQPVTKFDSPKVEFTSYQPRSVVSISVTPSTSNSPEEFRNSASLIAPTFKNAHPEANILGEGFGVYSIAGYDTHSILLTVNVPGTTNSLKDMGLTSRIGYQEMLVNFLADPESFDQQWPTVQKMINSIKITGIK